MRANISFQSSNENKNKEVWAEFVNVNTETNAFSIVYCL